MTEKKDTTEPVHSAAPSAESITSIANSVVGAVAIGEGARAESVVHVTVVHAGGSSSRKALLTQPVYADPEAQRLSEQFNALRTTKKQLQKGGQSTTRIDSEIQALRYKMREGGQLRAGDWLADKYLLIEHLGGGGFANVWHALRPLDGDQFEHVAIKVLHPDIARDPLKVKRFFEGARIMAEFKHEAIVRVLEPHGEDGGYFFFVMELVDGGDLRNAVRNGPLTLSNALSILLPVADALATLHGKDLTHRDVKPANILLTSNGTPRLTDFDILHDPDRTYLTRTQAMGTFGYSAPEVLERPHATKPSADVYSLGKCLAFCILGDDLTRDQSDQSALKAAINALRVGNALKAVIKKATEFESAARYSNAAEFGEAVKLAIKHDAGAPRRRLFALSVSITISVSGIGYIIKYPPAISPSMPRLEQTIAPPSPSPSAVSESTTINAMMSAMPPAPALSSDAGPEPTPGTSAKLPPLIAEKPPDCPDDMIRIPAGEFLMGTAPGGGGVNKQTVVMGQDYCIDKTEVTVEAYEECTSAKGCSAPASDPEVMYCSGAKTNMLLEGEAQGRHPITCVTWTQANTFCKWAEKRLPTEEEWEYAARGPKSLRFPWGDQWPKPDLLNACDTRCSNYHGTHDPTLAGKTLFDADDKSKMTAKVGSYPKGASPFGVVDMAGNVAEWADGFFCSYKDATCNRGDKRRVMRGSSWRDTQVYQVEAAHRTAMLDKPFNYVGFRCAKSLKFAPPQ